MRRMPARIALALLVLSAALGFSSALALSGAGGVARVAEPIHDSYLVTLSLPAAKVASEAARLAGRHAGDVTHLYTHALSGFSVHMSESNALALSREPGVALVEEDGVQRLVTTQSGPTWGLDRIDQRDLPLNSSYTYTANGSGVTAYVIDTGIRYSHVDFGGRAVKGIDEVTAGGDASDCHGHGTHVSGTIGGATYGVAKAVKLVAVRVLDCNGSGSTSGVAAGVDWVTGDHRSGVDAVANMSLGGSASTTLDNAVANSIADGVTYGIAAGNGNILGQAQDACTTSPARVASAITVGATDTSDTKASWSNYGTCLDIFGPGVNITSDWYSSDTATNTISGTSMATPHVVGVSAMYLSANPGKTPAQVASALTGNATLNHVAGPGTGSPNKLLYMGFISGTPPANQLPIASFTSSCVNLSCSFIDTSTDPDGAISSRSWNFGDGGTSTASNPSHAYATGGTYTVSLSVIDNAGASGSTSKSVTVSPAGTDPDPTTPNLQSGIATTGSNAAAGAWKYYKIQVPSGKTSLKVVLAGPACGLLSCNPDLDLFVKRAVKPTLTSKDCSGETGSSSESCTVSGPAADWYYVGVYTYSGSSGKSFSIKATFS